MATKRLLLPLCLCLFGSVAVAQSAQPDPGRNASLTRLERARVDAIDANEEGISLTDCVPGRPDPTKIACNGRAYHLKVSDQALRAKVKLYHVGDQIRADIKADAELQDVRGAWSYPPDGICPSYRFLALAACGFAIFGFAAIATKGSPLKFIVGADGRYSNSKFQIALWFWVLISTYMAVVVLRVCYAGWDFLGGITIPQNLLVLSGLSAITYGGAKAITTSKVNAAMNPQVNVTTAAAAPAPAAVAVAPAAGAAPVALTVTHAAAPSPAVVTVTPAANPDPKNTANHPPGSESFFNDLVKNDYGDFDFGDFQMLVVTFVAVGMYLALIVHFLASVDFLKTVSLPDVDTTVLAAFGLGQGAYLAKKAGGNVGTT
jgi:hypothetical protein